jgi:hypothetical protein
MSHLSLETLARCVDDTPSTEESAHLQTCELCRTELDALREDVQALGMLPDLAPSTDAWSAIESRLTDEGLIRGGSAHVSHARWSRPAAMPWLVRAAAAAVLFIGGTLAGRLTAAPEPVTSAQHTQPAAPARSEVPRAMLAADPGAQSRDASTERDVGHADANVAPRASASSALADPSGVRLASSGFAPNQLRNIDEAAALLRETESLYLAALTRYAEFATRSEEGDPIARLAALQSIVMTTQAALNQAPTDPVINGVHLATLAQRDATLAQVAAVSDTRWY